MLAQKILEDGYNDGDSLEFDYLWSIIPEVERRIEEKYKERKRSIKMENRKAEQRVKLLSITENPLKLVYTAARTCYSEDDAINVFDKDVEQETMLKLVNKILGYGHESIIEHFHVVFAIVGVSREGSHQHVKA